MKSIYLCLMVLCALAVAGCAGEKETSLANEGVTAEDLAAYEADLEAATGDDAFEDADATE